MFLQHVTHSITPCRFHRWLTVLLAVLLLFTLPAPKVQAASLTVNSLADADNGSDGVCTLREAITAANNNANYHECVSAGYGNDTITFSVGGTITLVTSLPNITDAAGLTINGGSAVTISGNNAVRVLQVNSGAVLTLQSLVIANGNAGSGSGGGIANFSGTVTASNSIISGNSASSTFGGGLYNNGGTMTVSNSTITGNSAPSGGGIYNGSSSTMTVSNSTISGNSASTTFGGGLENNGGGVSISNSTFSGNSANFGGGIYNGSSSTVTLTNSTISGNSANTGGGIRNLGGTVTLTNSILANSPSGGNCAGTIANSGHNLDSGTSCGWGSSNGSLSNTNPQLGPLATNGGPTQTQALSPSSPAIDAADNAACPSIDQRGF